MKREETAGTRIRLRLLRGNVADKLHEKTNFTKEAHGNPLLRFREIRFFE